ncbi:MAG: Hpt domain-containing protein [Rhodospirillaceae bacterium]|jgi:hypothetical protein|nr:Hpt domain-containing protein [Rhodospirillaceae bacterium]MBT5244289.1 Hpt domain-containing protein [Rhodospirillaceae bacterium]MBT5563650.1 Hpt domain-containing protein [Rhodospirillaceae bacterium]MBT6241480.1 Hpt domain-containing protein [Rhodospirillaceae bacterium]MBT7138817.1 Hpt domain-containing protein [Rhodospirillaceae bacterium]
MSDDDTVNVIKPPDMLSSKVSKGGPGAVDLAAIERAESVIANMADDYLDWVEDDLVKIANAQKELKANRDQSEHHLDKVFQVAHDMKGQGGSFGYDLMTILGNDLCRFIEGKKTASDVDIEVIDLYISTMQIVISKRMSGDGGPAGNEVLTGLAAVVAKITS